MFSNVCVCTLDRGYTRNDLITLCDKDGKDSQVEYIVKHNHHYRFVRFPTSEAADRVIAHANNTVYKQYEILVQHTEPRDRSDQQYQSDHRSDYRSDPYRSDPYRSDPYRTEY